MKKQDKTQSHSKEQQAPEEYWPTMKDLAPSYSLEEQASIPSVPNPGFFQEPQGKGKGGKGEVMFHQGHPPQVLPQGKGGKGEVMLQGEVMSYQGEVMPQGKGAKGEVMFHQVHPPQGEVMFYQEGLSLGKRGKGK